MQGYVPQKPVSKTPEDANRGQEMRVLVVDDNPMDTLLCQRLLERYDFRVTAANDPRLALADLERQPYDLLLVDIHMPYIDGFDLIEQARALLPKMAILLMTSFGTVETGILALQRGVDGLILKPFQDVESLVEAARGALMQKRQKRDAARLQILRPLFSITEKILSETNPQRLEALILRSIQDLLQSPHAIVLQNLPDQDSYTRLAWTHSSGLWDQVELVDALVELAQRQGGPLILDVGAPELASHQVVLSAFHIGSFLLVPVVQKSVHYIFVAGREISIGAFDEPELETFVIFARQVMIELENALLYEEQRRTLQQLKESQRALVQAEKMAAVGRLLASVAHEVNNPIQAVSNCLFLADRTDLDCEQRQTYLQMGRAELERLSDTVQRMLEYYRPGPAGFSPVSIPDVVSTALELLRQQLTTRQVEVICNFDSRLPQVPAVQNQIQQVIMNLVLNALESLDSLESKRNLWIEAEPTGSVVVIRVEDSGAGVPPGEAQHIFEPFYSTKPDGTGLGLAVCYNIVEAHRGSIRLVPSQHGTGACFQVDLPTGSYDGST